MEKRIIPMFTIVSIIIIINIVIVMITILIKIIKVLRTKMEGRMSELLSLELDQSFNHIQVLS